MENKNNWSPAQFTGYENFEHDACGVVSVMEKKLVPTHENIRICLDALEQLEHRAGFVNGEGDGIGIHLDIPRELWKQKLTAAGTSDTFVDEPGFAVGHFFIKKDVAAQGKTLILESLDALGAQLLFESSQQTRTEALGPYGQQEEPAFYQVAVLLPPQKKLEKTLLQTVAALEQEDQIHVASLSCHHVVYKVLGAKNTLVNYFYDLQNPLTASVMTLGHNRFSTNTLSSFFRVQPFSVIGHNGEINTIQRLRSQARLLDVPLVAGASDSQDLNRVLETLLTGYELTLFEAMDVVFPPILSEIALYDQERQALYQHLRLIWGHFAQGPAGIISRYKNEAVFSVDSLGLRPLWQVETKDRYVFASEPGVVSPKDYVSDPKPLAPGEKVGLRYEQGHAFHYQYPALQVSNVENFTQRFGSLPQQKEEKASQERGHSLHPKNAVSDQTKVTGLATGDYAAFGWGQDHASAVIDMAVSGVEPIRSLGWDSPLAALGTGRRNVADFLKETIAVVTNPAIDRDREAEHFSLQTVIGPRPGFDGKPVKTQALVLPSPLVLEAKYLPGEQLSFEILTSKFQTAFLSLGFDPETSLAAAFQTLAEAAVTAVGSGAELLVLDDARVLSGEQLWLDPHLAAAVVDQALAKAGLRRQCSVIVRSGSIRSLHDMMVLFGLGVEAVVPYAMFELAADQEGGVSRLEAALLKGISKVISTMGIHELRGYGRLFSAIGLHPEIAKILDIVNFFGGENTSYSLAHLEQDAKIRREDLGQERKLKAPERALMKLWKGVAAVANGEGYDTYQQKAAALENELPTSIRHLLDFKKSAQPVSKAQIGIKGHDLPFIISSMSFGSQNEVPFRAYAEAAQALNMLSLNGEGGELPELVNKNPHTRGVQVASGRFGVNAQLLNSANVIEIKINQGAKPGEGGHLPSSKVTEKIAAARNVTIGSDLLSPSNHHDIYSIEDLEQMIKEIKTINPQARVAVKVAIVPNIGTIAAGIVKAGADIVNLSGFDGGTGAARIHAIAHAGLPVEIGVKAAHNALIEAGLRDRVELWADGGIRSVDDVLKLMLLGANRVGFGTLAMIAVGCTTCRGCHLDTCHVGIATQIPSLEAAKARGLRRFVPRESTPSVERLIRLFTAFGEALQEKTAALGAGNLQDLVGRSDLLEQVKGREQLDLSPLFAEAMPPVLLGTPAAGTAAAARTAVTIKNRALVTGLVHERIQAGLAEPVTASFENGSTPGNGFAAYNGRQVFATVQGLVQDGTGKTATDSGVYVLKTQGADAGFYGGSAGKGFGYGAQAGSALYLQGDADARAGIRLSGGDMIIGGRLKQALPALEGGNLASMANIKGFAFEYMTGGRALVLGDPGPWICSGMTGGVVYLHRNPELGLTEEAYGRRLAKGAKVQLRPISEKGVADVKELLTDYQRVLTENQLLDEAGSLQEFFSGMEEKFYEIVAG